MDPVSIVGLVGTTVALVRVCNQIAQDLRKLSEKYQNTNTILTSIIHECRTLAAAVAQIQCWVEDTFCHLPSRQRQRVLPLNHALIDFVASLEPLEEEVSGMLNRLKPSGLLLRRTKLRYIWNEDRMKDHLDNLRWQANAIQLLLASTKLSAHESARRMEGIAKAASHFRDGSLFDDSGSTVAQVDFEFDDLLINTAVYRRAFQQYSNSLNRQVPETQRTQRPATPRIVEHPNITVKEEEEDLIDLSSEPDIPSSEAQTEQVLSKEARSQLREVEGLEASDSINIQDSHSSSSNLPTNPDPSQSLQEEERSSTLSETNSVSFEFSEDSDFWNALFDADIPTLDQLSTLSTFPDLNTRYSIPVPSDDDDEEQYESEPGDDSIHPLQFACIMPRMSHSSRKTTIKWLLDHGASPTFENSAGDPVMFALAEQNDVTLAKLLIKYGADVNQKGYENGMALHYAILSGALDMVRFLLENGADVFAVGRDGRTPSNQPFAKLGWLDEPIDEGAKMAIRWVVRGYVERAEECDSDEEVVDSRGESLGVDAK